MQKKRRDVRVCVCERERERVETRGIYDTENTQVDVYSQRTITNHYKVGGGCFI